MGLRQIEGDYIVCEMNTHQRGQVKKEGLQICKVMMKNEFASIHVMPGALNG